MTASDKRRRKRAKAALLKQSRSQSRAGFQSIPPQKENAKPLKLVLEVITAVVTVVTFAGFVYDALREPEIQAPSGAIDDPFLARFSLYNPSHIFSMNEVHVSCSLSHLKDSRDNRFSDLNLRLTGIGTVTSIAPRKSAQYQCPFRSLVRGAGEIVTTTVGIEVEFKTLFYGRLDKAEPFNWDNKSKRWTEGAIIN